VIGDLHGHFYDLLDFIALGCPPPRTRYLFLGDYVDRGQNSIETMAYALALKVKFPRHVWLLRGNHETPEMSREYGFLRECRHHYTEELWNQFIEVFRWLPLAAVVGGRIFCVHGGLSPDLPGLGFFDGVERPLDVPQVGPLVDILWADPSRDHSGFADSERGRGYTFGADAVEKFLDQNDLDLVCRAHQVVSNGFDFPLSPAQTVVTVFSASDYGPDIKNKAAMLRVGAGLRCSFTCLASKRLKPSTSHTAMTPMLPPRIQCW
jgi:serine/threonine-protein phosphatase PP1 catalytic subunit